MISAGDFRKRPSGTEILTVSFFQPIEPILLAPFLIERISEIAALVFAGFSSFRMMPAEATVEIT